MKIFTFNKHFDKKNDCGDKPLITNINSRDVQTKNVANNVDMSCLRAP